MEEELSTCTRNGFQTEITLTTQHLLAFVSTFEKMGLFIPGALMEDRVKRGHLRLNKKYLRELATTPQLAQVPLPIHGFKSVFSAASLARTKPPCIPPPESTRTGAQRHRTSCLVCPVVFTTEHRESCISCTSLVY